MKAPKMAGAATRRDAGNGPKFELLAGVLNYKNSETCLEWQSLGDATISVFSNLAARQAAWLRRRYPVDQAMASEIARLHFGESQQND